MNRSDGASPRRAHPRTALIAGAAVAAALGIAALALWHAPQDRPTSAPTAATPDRPASPAQSRVPEKQIFPDVRLTLTGVTRQGNRASALINVADRATGTYGVGQEITGGILVRSILPDRVVLQYGEALRTLYLKAAPSAASSVPSSDADALVEGYKEINPNIDPESLTLKRPMAAKEFLSEVKLAPNPRGGFTVEQVAENSVYQKMGLRPGDVIYSIDTPGTANVDESSMESVMNQVEMQLEIYRNGDFVLLRHRLDQ